MSLFLSRILPVRLPARSVPSARPLAFSLRELFCNNVKQPLVHQGRLEKNEIVQVSFNNYDRAPFRFEKELTLKFYEAIKTFDLIANNRDYQWRHILKPGELLIFNNWRILHGRGSFNGVRRMSGCYINKEDFDSSCKLNGIN